MGGAAMAQRDQGVQSNKKEHMKKSVGVICV